MCCNPPYIYMHEALKISNDMLMLNTKSKRHTLTSKITALMTI